MPLLRLPPRLPRPNRPRILNVFKKIPSQSVVTSICAPQVTDPTRADYGYRQVITALVERIRPSL
ncbi:MAG TPA: hypothetical protein PLI95_09485 [Polyangiaceae bacterium]|nr:hypothetical protein [Polyangiaceae bacterium]